MIRVLSRVAAVAVVVVAFGQMMGCASILGGGGKETIHVTSNPSGAQVSVYDKKSNLIETKTTPFNITLKRGDGYFSSQKYTFKATAASQPNQENVVKTSLNPWYIGNIVFGGLIGLVIVDPLTGAMFDLPNNVKIDFVPVPSKKADSGAVNEQKGVAAVGAQRQATGARGG